MILSNENKRLATPDNPELALTPAQVPVFANWCEGFDAQVAGHALNSCPKIGKLRRGWIQGWLSAAAVDRIAGELLSR